MEIEKCRVSMESLAELLALQLENGGRAMLTVTGSSMLPMLRHRRDQVELIPLAPRQNKGDIILYRRENGRYVLHRIVGVIPDGYICCGDNQAEKEWVKQEQLFAVVDGFTRKGRSYTLEHSGYRLYKALWVELFPLRPCYIAIRRGVGKLYRRLRKSFIKTNTRRNGQ